MFGTYGTGITQMFMICADIFLKGEKPICKFGICMFRVFNLPRPFVMRTNMDQA